jgi:DNA-binding FadR family transcriptional regulator
MAAARATPEQVQYLKSLAAELDDLGDLDGDYRGFLEQDRALHLALAESSRNRFLLAAMERIWMVNLRLWHLFFQHRGTGGPYFLHHDRIVTAIERGDSGAARDAMVDHIVASKQLLQTGLWG